MYICIYIYVYMCVCSLCSRCVQYFIINTGSAADLSAQPAAMRRLGNRLVLALLPWAVPRSPKNPKILRI